MGTIQEEIANLLRKMKSKPKEEPAEKEMNDAEKLVSKISDDKAPGVIQKRKKLYEEMEKATKDE